MAELTQNKVSTLQGAGAFNPYPRQTIKAARPGLG